MVFCQACGNQVQMGWAVCPHCSNPLPQTLAQPATQQTPVVQNLTVYLVKKRVFPTIKITVVVKDELYGLQQEITLGTLARTYTAKLPNGMVIGKLPLQGATVFSGAQGMISFPTGHSYNVELMTGPLGPKGLTITDWNTGRKCMTTF